MNETEIRTTDTLRGEELLDLAEGRLLAIRVPGYCPEPQSEILSQRLLNHHRLFRYSENPNVLGIGMDFWDPCKCGKDEESWLLENPDRLRDRYYEEARPAICDMRRALEPYLSPMDKLRLELQEAWPAGANLGNVEGRPMFVGVARVFEDGAEAFPHDDKIGRVIPDAPKAQEFLGQLSCNIYLQTSREGGELELWRERLTSETYGRFHMDDSTYGVRREELPPSEALLQPQVGELILFDATRLHAVRKVQGSPRVALSCFVGYRGPESPLEFWS